MSEKQVSTSHKQVATLRDMLDKSKSQIQLALPKHMDASRLLRVAMTSVQKTPELLACDPLSVVRSVIEAAQLGLEPDGILGHAYLVPYKRKCQLIVGYKGMISLAYRSGAVASIGGEVVFEADEFEFEYGLTEKLRHVPNFKAKDRGKPVCVYAVAHMKDGGHAFVVLPVSEVERHRQRSAMPNSPAWKNDWNAMAVKTAVRVLAKWMPQSPELQRAASKEEAMEAGAEIDEPVIDITDSQVPPKTRAAEVSDKIKGKGKAEKEPERDDPPPPEGETDNGEGGTGFSDEEMDAMFDGDESPV